MGIGLSYFTPLMCGWEFLPTRRGFVSGIIIGGFGFGTFIFSLISTALVNPNNKEAETEKITNIKVFPWEVA